MKNRKQLYLEYCNAKQSFFNDFDKQESKSKYKIDGTCIACGKPNVDDVFIAYWSPLWQSIHKACKVEFAKEQAFQCQLIDANCNDCKFFTDAKAVKGMGGARWREGVCAKKNIPVVGTTNFCQSNGCFEHRKVK